MEWKPPRRGRPASESKGIVADAFEEGAEEILGVGNVAVSTANDKPIRIAFILPPVGRLGADVWTAIRARGTDEARRLGREAAKTDEGKQAMTKKKAGQKPAAGTARETVVPVRLSVSEAREIKKAAKAEGRPVSNFIRNAALTRAREST